MAEPLPVPDVDVSHAHTLRSYPFGAQGRAIVVAYRAPGPNEIPSWLMLWQTPGPDGGLAVMVAAHERVFSVGVVTQQGHADPEIVADTLAPELTHREALEMFAHRLIA